ncbi:MAG: hypothetical protein QG579_436, partial [Patescibacteria group bacterium]|nr:hypothetical protein [Patescibacteria group bacterium]
MEETKVKKNTKAKEKAEAPVALESVVYNQKGKEAGKIDLSAN